MSNPVPRRNWVLGALQSAMGLTLAAIFYPVVRFLWPREATTSGAMEIVAPYRMDQLKPDAEGHWPPPFNFGRKPCLLILVDGEPRAFNAVCTHVQCTVEYRPQ